MKKKLFFLSVSRSDFDRYYSILSALNKINKSENVILISGSHYSKKFGYTHKVIENSGFKFLKAIDKKYITEKTKFATNILNISKKLSKLLEKFKPDLLIILGDRYEMLSGPLSCLDKKIPIVHIHGGAVTYGAIDDNIRHSLTKLSNYHIVSHTKYLNRIIQMGEEKWRVKNLGAPGLDYLKKFKNNEISKVSLLKYNLIKKEYILICYNPETHTLENLKNNTKIILDFLKTRNEIKIFTYPNSDPGCDYIINAFKKFTSSNQQSFLYKNLVDNDFYPILKNCKFLFGNSSVGIVEAASFKIPVLNIGQRQEGKIHPMNVVNCDYSINSIKIAMKKIESKKYLIDLKILKNPYGNGNSGAKIADHLLKIKINKNLIKKKFIDK